MFGTKNVARVPPTRSTTLGVSTSSESSCAQTALVQHAARAHGDALGRPCAV